MGEDLEWHKTKDEEDVIIIITQQLLFPQNVFVRCSLKLETVFAKHTVSKRCQISSGNEAKSIRKEC